MYVIVLLMFVTLGAETDALEVSHKDGKLLEFHTYEDCYNHVAENIDDLKEFAKSEFDGAPIKKILCVQKY
tara:strand:- start:198 stop:410 length:213 start_codon:yes stop_codon:yes gene_type:complete